MQMGTRPDASAKSLMKLSWPIFIELILQLLVGNMDQIQLSHFNETAVAAVGNANTIITVVLLTFNVISLAAMILVSHIAAQMIWPAPIKFTRFLFWSTACSRCFWR